MNLIAKLLLVSTSLSPVCFVLAVKKTDCGEPWTSWIWLLAALPTLMALCWWMLRCAAKKAQRHLLEIKEFERKDQEMLTFLFIYLLPIIRSENATFASEPLTAICALGIIFVAIADVGAFHFNPVMRVFRYRFYAIKTSHGVSNLLISKKDLCRPNQEIQTVRIATNVYLHTEDADA